MCHFKKHTKQEMEGRKSHDNFLSKLFAGPLSVCVLNISNLNNEIMNCTNHHPEGGQDSSEPTPPSPVFTYCQSVLVCCSPLGCYHTVIITIDSADHLSCGGNCYVITRGIANLQIHQLGIHRAPGLQAALNQVTDMLFTVLQHRPSGSVWLWPCQ